MLNSRSDAAPHMDEDKRLRFQAFLVKAREEFCARWDAEQYRHAVLDAHSDAQFRQGADAESESESALDNVENALLRRR